jgi:hypothetical protein
MINSASNHGVFRKQVNTTETNQNNYLLKNAKGNTITQQQNSTSNYTTLINWKSDGKTYLKYLPEIGHHNSAIGGEAGIGTEASGAITILPYSTDTSPWNGMVGLYIGKNTLKLDGKNVLTSAGGTIDGKIYSSVSSPLQRNVDTGTLQVLGGTEYTKGGYLYLTGQDYTSDPGSFTVAASANGTICRLKGKPDGTLSWNGNTIIFVKTSYTSGDSWYRVYSDGWVEQGGSGSINEYATLAITLLKPMKNANYIATVINAAGKTAANAEGCLFVKTRATTTLTISCGYIDPNTSPFLWSVCGYGA